MLYPRRQKYSDGSALPLEKHRKTYQIGLILIYTGKIVTSND
jgi:hypothetical protein